MCWIFSPETETADQTSEGLLRGMQRPQCPGKLQKKVRVHTCSHGNYVCCAI